MPGEEEMEKANKESEIFIRLKRIRLEGGEI